MRHYSADLHLLHDNIIGYCNRPFRDAGHMSQQLLRNFHAVVQPDDDLIIVGDLAMGRIEDSLQIASELPGNKFLVPGNHDRCFPGSKREQEWKERYEQAGFTILPTLIVEPAFTVCHFPPVGDSRHEDRYSEHRPPDTGGWFVHGHVHDSWKVQDRFINVGVDVNNYAPISETDIMSIINGG